MLYSIRLPVYSRIKSTWAFLIVLGVLTVILLVPGWAPQNVLQNGVRLSVSSAGRNSRQQLNKNSNNKRPYFVIHVGPPKTGTTSVQCTLRSLRKELHQDGYFVYHTHSCSNPARNGAGFRLNDCLRKNSTTPPPPCVGWYLNQFHNISTNIRSAPSIIISDEFLYPPGPLFPYFVEMLSKEYQVVIVATYRHFFEWMLSVHTQEYKHQEWGHNKHIWRPSLLSTKYHIHLIGEAKRDPFHYFTEGVVASSSSFRLLNYHADPLVPNFICYGLPSTAKSACRTIQAVNETIRENSGSIAYMFDSVVLEANRQNLMPEKFKKARKRHFAAEKLARYFGTANITDLPLICPSMEKIDAFWSATKDAALAVSKNKAADGSSIDFLELRAKFDQIAQSGLWCSIDATKLLERPKWRKNEVWK